MKVFVKTPGCAKDLLEAETISGNLLKDGRSLTSDLESVSAFVVHTSSFIGDARKESIEAIKLITKKRAQKQLSCL